MSGESLVERLSKRAAIRRQIPTRKSVQEGEPDRIAELLEEAAKEIIRLQANQVPTAPEGYRHVLEGYAITAQGEPATVSRHECPYCTSDNAAIRSTYYDQTCEGCVKRMGKP